MPQSDFNLGDGSMNQESMADAPVIQPGHSRRNFIKGVIAAGATVSASAYLFRTTIAGQNESMAGAVERLITLDINGQQRRVDVLKNERLATTDGTLSPVQQAVVEGQGFQCAFCMPGFVMAATGYLKTNPNPTREQLAHGISGNLCRCADYNKILTAMMRGAENMRRT